MNFFEQIIDFLKPVIIYFDLFGTFFVIGAFTFGGGYAMLPLIQQQVVEKQWMTLERVNQFVSISESTPGPFAVNMATYVGAELTGSPLGSVFATLGVVLPSFIVILIVAKCYDKFRESRVVKGCMSGLKPAVVGLIANAVLGVLMTVFFPTGLTPGMFTQVEFYIYAAMFVGALILAFKKMHPILLICISAMLGIAVGYLC